MHQDEKWQVFAENGKAIAGEWWPAELDNPEKTGSDKIVAAVTAFLYRQTDHGLEFLWQKRSEKLRSNPGMYDISAGGHINLGETPIEAAVREAREEIGAEIDPTDLRLVESDRANPNRFIWTFVTDWTGKDCNFHFDDEEVSEVKWVPYSEMTEFREKYAKKALRKTRVTFPAIDMWLEMHGLIENGNL